MERNVYGIPLYTSSIIIYIIVISCNSSYDSLDTLSVSSLCLSLSFLDQRALGMSMRVERASLQQVSL